LKKINQQGTEVSDTLIFDASVGAEVINGSVYSYAGCINSFYKSTNSSEFIPYFCVYTSGSSNYASQQYTRVFKYINNAFSQIYESSPQNLTLMGTGSGPDGTQMNIIT